MRRPEIVKQIGDAIKHTDNKAVVILYGSEARGDARPDSDIDVLILVDGDHLSPKRAETYTEPLNEIEWNSGVLISPMVVLKKDWENRPFKTPFFINVKNEGIRL